MTLRTPTAIRPWSLPELGHVLLACAGVRGKHRQLGQAVLQMALLEHACTDDPPRAAGLVERVAKGSKKAAAEITALLDARHHRRWMPTAGPRPTNRRQPHRHQTPRWRSLWRPGCSSVAAQVRQLHQHLPLRQRRRPGRCPLSAGPPGGHARATWSAAVPWPTG